MSFAEGLSLVGAVITVAALVLTACLITPGRYQLNLVAYDSPGLKKLVRHQGRLTMLAAVGATLVMVAQIVDSSC